MDLGRHREYLGWGLALVATWSIVAGIAELAMSVPDLGSGELHVVTRVVLALLGVAAGIAMWLLVGRGKVGWFMLLAWLGLQIPHVMLEPGGTFTRQLFEFPLALTTQHSVNGQLVEYSVIGVDLLALGLFLFVQSRRRAVKDIDYFITQDGKGDTV